jgi:SRSO17 transposase
MGLEGELEMTHRLAAYLGELTTVVGHAGRVRPLMAYCAGLLVTPGRRNAEAMAEATKPACVPAWHQSLMHIVANSEWSDEQMLAKVREQVVPSMTRRGPIEVWIIDDTSFPKQGKHSVGVQSVLRAARQAGQLPGGGDAVDRQPSCQPADRLSAVSAA